MWVDATLWRTISVSCLHLAADRFIISVSLYMIESTAGMCYNKVVQIFLKRYNKHRRKSNGKC